MRPEEPIARLLGARVRSVESGRVLVEFAVKPEFMHPGKVIQGGIVTAYGDVCMALAAHALRSAAGAEYARASSVRAVRRPQK